MPLAPSPFAPWFALAASLALPPLAIAADDDPDLSKLPPAAARTVDFSSDIQPILEHNCLRCHGPERPKSRFRLDNREDALKGGATDIAIVPGDSAHSPLIHYVARLVEDMEMPPADKGDPLTAEQVGLLRAWIDAGAQWSPPAPQSEFTAAPYFGWITVRGNERAFREHHWRDNGFGGGIEYFQYHKQLDPDRGYTLDGHVRSLASDYKVRLSIDQRELGFVRGGFSQFRRYYTDQGGYYEPFPTSAFSLGDDLHVDFGKLWIETGLTRPGLPQAVLGYEFHYRDGEKSLTAWGPSTQAVGAGNVTRNIFPSSKDVDEQLHLVRLDLTHEIGGFELEDNLRYENHSLQTSRTNPEFFDPGEPVPNSSSRVEEYQNQNRVANAFRVQKQIKDWWLASTGHFYSRTDANAAFASSTIDGAGQPVFGNFWTSQQILLERDSHYLNLNSLFGPWEGLHLATGVRGELTWQEALGNIDQAIADPSVPLTFSQPSMLDANIDKHGLEENALLRYTKIPRTVLYAEARFNQDWIDHRESKVGGIPELVRDTDTTSRRSLYKTGFNFSPQRAVSLQGSYARRLTENRYRHDVDLVTTAVDSITYSAFIRGHDFTSDEIEAKLVTRPANWIRATLSWKWLATDYETDTADVSFAPDIVPGGSILSGNYDAHIYSLGLTLTPIRRLYCSVILSYTDSRTVSRVNGASAVAPYSGDVYSLLSSANYAWNEKTDLFASYAWSLADYAQDNAAGGLPVGPDFRQDAAQAGIRRRFTDHVSAAVRYGFFRYRDPSLGGFSDYTAHAVFTTLALTLP